MSKLTRVIQSVRQNGFAPVVRRNLWRLWWRWQEQRWQLDTGGSIDNTELGFQDGFGYQPIDARSFHLAMQHLELKETDVFADFGCGKGRAVILAARLPIQKSIGIELSAELCEVAQRNVERAKASFLCQETEITHANALEYELPADLSIVFMYNPFDGPIVEQLLERLETSLRSHPRPLQIVYALPRCRPDVLSECPWLAKASEVTTDNADWERMSVYRAIPERIAASTDGRELAHV